MFTESDSELVPINLDDVTTAATGLTALSSGSTEIAPSGPRASRKRKAALIEEKEGERGATRSPAKRPRYYKPSIPLPRKSLEWIVLSLLFLFF